jgi:CDP-diacylglycerol--serine O-phosphatidyltransferase
MNRLRTVAVLPTLFTLGNLVCGFFAIVVASRVETPASVAIPANSSDLAVNPVQAMRSFDKEDPVHNVMLSGWLIVLGMIFDALDGHVARLAKSSSNFGAELDSLCDLVTFGVAPAFLMVKMLPTFTYLHQEVWILAAVFAACAAIRLARFNVETDEEDDHLNFSGLPSPAAAASIASFAFLFYSLRREHTPWGEYKQDIDTALQYVLPFFALAVAVLMVSRIPYPHVVNQLFRGQRGVGHVVGVFVALALIFKLRSVAVPAFCALFVLWGPIRYGWQELVQRKPHEEPLF